MPYKDKAKQQEYQRKLMEKRRGLTRQGLTGLGLTNLHPIMGYLVDPVKRAKLEAIAKGLAAKKLGSEVYFGVGDTSIDFNMVGQLLEVTA